MALPLVEQFRPTRLDDIVGQDKAVTKIRRMAGEPDETGFHPNLAGRVWWLVGPSGSGKTTAARIIARMAAQKYAIDEFPADDFSRERIRDIESICRMRPIGGGIHAFVANESHLLRGPILAALNTLFEHPNFLRNGCCIFTTTNQGQAKLFDADEIETVPFGSRTIPVTFVTPDVVLMAERIRTIAQSVGRDGKPLADYLRLVKDSRLNWRTAINAVDAGVMLD